LRAQIEHHRLETAQLVDLSVAASEQRLAESQLEQTRVDRSSNSDLLAVAS
jgi:hypothetical protein